VITAAAQATARVIGLGLGLLAAKSQGNSRDQQAVAEFRAYKYRKEGNDPKGKIELSTVEMLSPKEVERACQALRTVQKYVDAAAKTVNARELEEGKRLSNTQYGTAVHKETKDQVDELKRKGRNPHNLSAELSFAKTMEANYGTKDSIRIDLHEPRRPTTLCIYDIKTGNETRNIVTPKRAAEIADNVAAGGYTHVFITEVRPGVERNPPF
jgi:hypothetical protein